MVPMNMFIELGCFNTVLNYGESVDIGDILPTNKGPNIYAVNLKIYLNAVKDPYADIDRLELCKNVFYDELELEKPTDLASVCVDMRRLRKDEAQITHHRRSQNRTQTIPPTSGYLNDNGRYVSTDYKEAMYIVHCSRAARWQWKHGPESGQLEGRGRATDEAISPIHSANAEEVRKPQMASSTHSIANDDEIRPNEPPTQQRNPRRSTDRRITLSLPVKL